MGTRLTFPGWEHLRRKIWAKSRPTSDPTPPRLKNMGKNELYADGINCGDQFCQNLLLQVISYSRGSECARIRFSVMVSTVKRFCQTVLLLWRLEIDAGAFRAECEGVSTDWPWHIKYLE